MTSGERRLAERLESKLDDDYRLWYDVPMGQRNTHPDFCVMHPRRGILVLEVKDWKTGSTILQADKQNWEIMGDNGPKTVINPLEQARQYAREGAGARRPAGAARRRTRGQAGFPLELRRGVYQYHPQAVRNCRAAARH